MTLTCSLSYNLPPHPLGPTIRNGLNYVPVEDFLLYFVVSVLRVGPGVSSSSVSVGYLKGSPFSPQSCVPPFQLPRGSRNDKRKRRLTSVKGLLNRSGPVRESSPTYLLQSHLSSRNGCPETSGFLGLDTRKVLLSLIRRCRPSERPSGKVHWPRCRVRYVGVGPGHVHPNFHEFGSRDPDTQCRGSTSTGRLKFGVRTIDRKKTKRELGVKE